MSGRQWIARHAIGQAVRGTALVAHDGFSARYDLTARFPETDLVEANIPRHHWQSFTGASVFRVRRDDLLI